MAYLNAIKLIDELGVPYGVKQIENKPRIVSTPYTYQIAEGAVPGHSPVRIFGRNTDIDNVREEVWDFGGAYVFPPAGGIQMRVVSTSASDTAAGTGARTVEIRYLDNLYAEQVEVVTLNGVTPVNTVATNILRVNQVYVDTAGTGGTAAGNISLQNVAGTVTYSYISLGFNIAQQAIYTVPAAKNFFLVEWAIGAGAATQGHFTQFFLRATLAPGDTVQNGLFYIYDMALIQDASIDLHFEVPLFFPEKTDIIISAISDSATATVTVVGTFSGWSE